MKNIILTSLVLFLSITFASAQLTIKAPNGDVGVGTSLPSYKLHVDGDTYSKDGYYMSNSANTITSRFFIPSNNVLARHQFRPVTTNKASGFYLSPNGTGTTAGSSTFFALFSTDFGNGAPDFEIMQLQAGASNTGINMRANGSGTLREFHMMTNYTKRMVMTTNGKFGFGTSTPSANVLVDVAGAIGYNGTLTNTSDKRLKKNISKFEYGLKEILLLDPINYNYNGKGGTDSKYSHVGIFAQDLQKIAPELVGEFLYIAPDYTVVEDEDGDEFPTLLPSENKKSEKYLNIKESAIKYMLINAIQEQQELISQKDLEIKELSTKIETLEVKVNTILENGTGSINQSTVQLTYEYFAELEQNKPNPFNGFTTIDYIIPSDSKSASINIIDASGRIINSSSVNHVGKGSLKINATNFPSGTYFYELIIDQKKMGAKSMTLIK